MLDYENQILLDLLHEDGLLVMAKGMGIERVLVALLSSYSDAGNLVLIIGTTPKEEEYVLSCLDDMDVIPSPKCITAECSVSERNQMYLDGGCLFVTSRILVVDLLIGRVPVNLITGIIVWKAHKVLESGMEAFILRLYRQQNKKGFIKALSGSPLSFTLGFCHVERVMKNLFVKKLYIWPRFHADINSSLSKCKPEVIELHLQMSPAMKQIQLATLDLISSTLQELRLSNRMINIDEFCTENAISPAFEKIIKIQLDPIWHQLSTRTKQLVADLKVLRTVLTYLTQYDSVTFCNLVNSLRTTEKAMQSAGWMLLPAAESLFINAKQRVLSNWKPSEKTKKGAQNADGLSPEVNPKWLALSEVLAEIRNECLKGTKYEKCLVVTSDDRTEKQLREYLVDGANNVLKRLFYSTLGPKLGLQPPPPMKDAALHNPTKEKEKKTDSDPKKTFNKLSEMTLTQITKKYDCIGVSEGEKDMKLISEEVDLNPLKKDSLLILIHPLKGTNNQFTITKLLEEVQPKYIVMYDSDLCFVRQVEVWQAANSEFNCRVYFLVYKGTTEEQIYLTSIKREKDAFEHLIKEKTNMVLPEYVDGKSDDHPELHPIKEDDIMSISNHTRQGGGATDVEKVPEKVVVDMREFRSELPAIIHKRGIEIEPATIEVGDYVLTPDICVERKSISDLIGSLGSGRLYNQAQSMTRFYKKPILLIEFDHSKPFHLQGRLLLSNDASSSTKDLCSKLILLTIHFPLLRLLWSPSPYVTAELFHMLKIGKVNPVVSDVQAIKTDNASIDTDKFNPQIKDFVSKLPGVTSKNIYSLLRRVEDLPSLLRLTAKEIEEIFENSKNALQLHTALHAPLDQPPQQESSRSRIRKKFGKPPIKKFKSL